MNKLFNRNRCGVFIAVSSQLASVWTPSCTQSPSLRDERRSVFITRDRSYWLNWGPRDGTSASLLQMSPFKAPVTSAAPPLAAICRIEPPSRANQSCKGGDTLSSRSGSFNHSLKV